jgi:hypothetical protein
MTAKRKQSDQAHASSDLSFLEFVDQEIAEAEREIAKLQQKIAVLVSLRSNFVTKPSDAAPAAGPRFTSKQMLATEAIADFLRQQQDPVPTTQILNYLGQKGIKFGGRQPRNALSVLLSRSDLFKAHGRQGWTLAER